VSGKPSFATKASRRESPRFQAASWKTRAKGEAGGFQELDSRDLGGPLVGLATSRERGGATRKRGRRLEEFAGLRENGGRRACVTREGESKDKPVGATVREKLRMARSGKGRPTSLHSLLMVIVALSSITVAHGGLGKLLPAINKLQDVMASIAERWDPLCNTPLSLCYPPAPPS
jgi:hypothetical protein